MGFRLDKHIYTNWIEVFLLKINEYILNLPDMFPLVLTTFQSDNKIIIKPYKDQVFAEHLLCAFWSHNIIIFLPYSLEASYDLP